MVDADRGGASLSVTVTVTDDVPVTVGVPVTTPVVGSIARPAGRLAAEKVSV